MGIYLDYNATSPLRAEARQAIESCFDLLGNPSSVHHFGQAARHNIEKARQKVAALVDADRDEVIFVSGGTEANAMAIMRNFPQVITTAIEHPSVLACAEKGVRIGVDRNGVIDLHALDEAASSAPQGSLISVMAANNETGVIQPLDGVVAIGRKYNHFIHSDGIQALGKMPLNFKELGLDFLSLSAHKIGGMAGIGALVQRQGLKAFPRLYGGGQEKMRRPGTENILGIISFGAAAAVAGDNNEWSRLRLLRDDFENEVKAEVPDVKIYGEDVPRLPNTSNIVMRGRSAEMQVLAFDLEGIAVSSGSACSSGKVQESHVLAAMDMGDDLGSAIRISIGFKTKISEMRRLAEIWLKLYNQCNL